MAEIESIKKEFCNNVVIVEMFVPNPDAVSCVYHIFYNIIPDLSKDPTTLKLLDLNIPKLVYNMYKPFGIKLLNDEDGIKMATITADNSRTAE